MTAGVMAFLVLVSALAGAAALAADAGLRRLGLPTRGVWLAALLAGPLLLALSALGWPAAGGVGAVPGPVPVVELPGLVVGGGGEAASFLSVALAALWALSVPALAWTLVRAHRTLARERAGWSEARVLGRTVLVSPGRGPAVGGLRSGWIVLPRWALTLPEEELRLVLAHEEEHLRARDPHLLALALLSLLVAPWNPVAWWQLRRLRTAMEVDCDRRVLARHPDRRVYGASLLSVAERASGPSLALAAFSERSSSLEERILTMTRMNDRKTKVLGVLLALGGVFVGVQACGVDSPLAPPVDEAPAGAAEAPEIEIPAPTDDEAAAEEAVGEPRFTPFTVAPSITNRMEVIQAMQAEYPPLLREAGVGGSARVYFFIDADGVVRDVRLDQSSGHEALDRAALQVARVFEFDPARNGDEAVPVWVSFPITFQAR